MSGLRVLRGLIVASIAAFVLAGGFGAYELARPGCSPFPVAVPTDDPNNAAAAKVDATVICAVLGRPMPRVTSLPAGVHEANVFYSPPPRGTHGFLVTITYGRDTHGVAELDVLTGDGIPISNQGQINGRVQGVPAIVSQQPYTAPPGVPFFMSYLWSKDGLLYVLHVRLGDGIDAATADAMAESVR